MEKEKWKKATLILGGILCGAIYMIGGLKKEVQQLKNENLNLRDLNLGQEDTIRALNYGLGKLKNKQ